MPLALVVLVVLVSVYPQVGWPLFGLLMGRHLYRWLRRRSRRRAPQIARKREARARRVAAAPKARAASPSTPPPPPPTPATWTPDPSGRHQLRYWSGTAWTEHVSDNGAVSTDPLS